jgi:hypothetical protein
VEVPSPFPQKGTQAARVKPLNQSLGERALAFGESSSQVVFVGP